jgi:MFS superfamily sulfate permease-like transporter
MTDFIKGIIIGFLSAIIIFCVVMGFIYSQNKEKEIKEYEERQIELQELRESISNRDPDEFLEIPDVRRAADGAAAEFERKRDEALQRFRSRNTD